MTLITYNFALSHILIALNQNVEIVGAVDIFPQVDKHGPTFEIQPEEKRYASKGKMLYLVAHSFLNGQSKKLNFFPLPELHETQFKKTRGAPGTRMEILKFLKEFELIERYFLRFMTMWKP